MALTFGITFGDLTFGATFGPLADVEPEDPTGVVPLATATLSQARRAAAALIGGRMNELYRGEAVTLYAVVLVDGAAVPLTGSSEVSAVEYSLRLGALEIEAEPALTKTIGAGVTVDTAAATLAIAISSADSAALPPGLYFEQVAVEFADAPGQWVYVVRPQRRVVHGAVNVPA